MTEYRINGDSGAWEVVIGLEVHAQIATDSKLFSSAATGFGAEPNTQVSFIDAAMPGMLPVPNREAIRQTVRTGMAIEARINHYSRFDRKNYFYADLPQGYQITQLYHPLVGEGALMIEADEKAGIPEPRQIGIERIHIEQDAGKLMHDQHPSLSLVDLNRCGIALMEIVSKPDMRSPAEAGAYVRKLRAVLRYVGSCDGNMDQGSMRADVNVSVRRVRAPSESPAALGTRTETKNVNSVRFIQQVVDYEARRQVKLIESGDSVAQETRLFDPGSGGVAGVGGSGGVTRPMRSKEDAHDYRYFPDPDLLPLELDDAFLAECRASLPELPDAKRMRYEERGISAYNAAVLTAEVDVARWFDALLDELSESQLSSDASSGAQPQARAEPVTAANWVTGELFGALNRFDCSITDSPVSPPQAVELLTLIADGTISNSIAKQVLEKMIESGDGAAMIVEREGLKQTSDSGVIEGAVAKVLADNADKVEQYKSGKQVLFGFFVGQTMKAMRGKANPQMVNALLRKALD